MSDEARFDTTTSGPANKTSGPANNPRNVLLRDLLLFQMKLWMDGLKDIVLSPLSIIACIVDVLFRRSGQRSLFYGVMRLGERFDLWLNLYGPATRADTSPDGLLGRNGLRGRDMADMVDADTRRPILPIPAQPSSSSSPSTVHPRTPPESTR